MGKNLKWHIEKVFITLYRSIFAYSIFSKRCVYMLSHAFSVNEESHCILIIYTVDLKTCGFGSRKMVLKRQVPGCLFLLVML